MLGMALPTHVLLPAQSPLSIISRLRHRLRQLHFFHLEQAWKTPNGNYEVRDKGKNGKVRDIRVKPDSEVVEGD